MTRKKRRHVHARDRREDDDDEALKQTVQIIMRGPPVGVTQDALDPNTKIWTSLLVLRARPWNLLARPVASSTPRLTAAAAPSSPADALATPAVPCQAWDK